MAQFIPDHKGRILAAYTTQALPLEEVMQLNYFGFILDL
jgi:hypothetical protein